MQKAAENVAKAQPSAGNNEINFYFLAAETVSEGIKENIVGSNTSLTINNLLPVAFGMTKAYAEREVLKLHEFYKEGDSVNPILLHSIIAVAAKHGSELKTIGANVLSEYNTKKTVTIKTVPTIAFTTQLFAEYAALYHASYGVILPTVAFNTEVDIDGVGYYVPHKMVLGFWWSKLHQFGIAQEFEIIAKLASHWNEPQHASKTTGAYVVETLANSNFIIDQIAHTTCFFLTSKALLEHHRWNQDPAILAPIKAMAIGIIAGVTFPDVYAPVAKSLYAAYGASYMAPVYQLLHSYANEASKWAYTYVGQPIQKHTTPYFHLPTSISITAY